MYQIVRRSAERPWGESSTWLANSPDQNYGSSAPLILRMQENRSQLSGEARACFSALAALFLVTAILPALEGRWLIPAYSLAAMAALTFALERHSKSSPAKETLELGDGKVRHCDSSGRVVELPAFWMRLVAESPTPATMRLFLRSRDGAIEFGHCLSFNERRAVAPLVAAALAEARGG